MELSTAFVSAHPILASLTAWLLVNVAYAAVWHRVRSRHRDMEYERDLIALELATAEEVCENKQADDFEVPTFSRRRDPIRVG